MRRSRKLINEMKELPKKSPDVRSCSRHLTSLRVFYSDLCQLLTSLEFSICEKQCLYLSIFSGDLYSTVACYIARLKTFIIEKIKKIKYFVKYFAEEYDISHFPKSGITEFFRVTNSPRLFTPGETKALAKYKVHQ